MKPDTLLDSAVFQLTPTRTRCDLVISANGKTEKIASGLLNPFLAHLSSAQDQISKGGYSITLEPDHRKDHTPWFTKGTVERFVRFVSTPEVLERVSTIESEMLQIAEAISVQGNESLGSSTVDDHQQTARPPKSLEGRKSLDADTEKAIVLYKAGSLPSQPDSTGYTTQEENSKVQLLRVLETRKTMLQKEQAMAFARAAAASFDMDHMAHLISFAGSFGASRLKKACVSYMELWKIKHETGQWLEVDAAEAMSFPPEFASVNGIILSGDIGEAGNDNNGELNSDHNRDQRHSPAQMPPGPQEHFHGQYQHPAYPQWPMHGQPMYQPYPMQGMPYYQNYPGNPPFFQPPYPPMEDPRFTNSQKTRRKRQSMDSKDAESDPSESSTRSPKDVDDGSEPEKEATEGRESRKRHGRSRKKQSGMVVIRNLNYISKRAETSGSESDSGSNSEAEEETEGMLARILEGKHKKSGSSRKKDGHKKSTETSNAYVEDDVVSRREEDSGNWNAFQSSLLRAEENTSTVTGDMFSGERDPPVKRRNNQSEDDPLVHTERTSGDVRELRVADFDSVKSKVSRFNQIASDDVLLISSEGRGLRDSQQSSHFREMEGGGGGYQRANDDFIVYGQEQHMGGRSSSHPLADYESNHIGNSDKKPYNATDESYMVPFRSGTQDQFGADRRATIDMDSEYPALKCPEKDSSVAKNQNFYEPDDLTLMPERDFEDGSNGYDPARDYDYEVPIDVSANQESINQEVIPESVEEVPKKSENGKNLKVARKGMERRKEPIVRKGAISKSSTLIEAQKRAEKLRAYKLDLQKEKKEKEEEGIRRLEALKREREKRIAARSNSGAAQSLPAKISLSSSKGLKFGDSEAESSSPLRKLSTRASSISSIDSQKIATASRVNVTTNGLSRSVSSLPELKKESIKAESKADPMRLKRLSEPKVSSIDLAVKPKNTPKDPKTKISAITQLDKTKSATLPELKVKASKSPTAVQKSATKETQKGSGRKTSPIPEIIQAKKSEEKAPRCSNSDDNAVLDPVVEKTVVILESGNVPAPIVQASKESVNADDKLHKDDGRDRTAPVSEYVAIRAPPSPIENEVYSTQSQLDEQLSSSEVVIPKESKVESQKSVDSTTVEKTYQAPYARASSLDDPAVISAPYARASSLDDSAVISVEHSEAPRVLSSEVATPVVESNFKADVPTSVDQDSLEQNQEMSDKPRSKQSGFRKLLKFGRKSNNPASSEGNQDSDGPVVDDNEASASSNDVNLLKNLISQDDVYVGGTSKTSRPFSLLSPFRKASDKKIQYA